MRPRPTRYLREHVTGRILSVRDPSDPVFDLVTWMADPDVRAYFAHRDRLHRLAHGATVEDEKDRERQERAARMRLLERIAMRRETR
jgi:hypothetical protein